MKIDPVRDLLLVTMLCKLWPLLWQLHLLQSVVMSISCLILSSPMIEVQHLHILVHSVPWPDCTLLCLRCPSVTNPALLSAGCGVNVKRWWEQFCTVNVVAHELQFLQCASGMWPPASMAFLSDQACLDEARMISDGLTHHTIRSQAGFVEGKVHSVVVMTADDWDHH